MRFTLNGDQFELDVETVTSRLRGRTPEPIQVPWVEVDAVRFPVQQALEAALGVSRTTYTSQRARSIFDRLGLPTSASQLSAATDGARRVVPRPAKALISVEEAGAAFSTLVAFCVVLRLRPVLTNLSVIS